MRKELLLLAFLTSFFALSQPPNYSELRKIDKLKLMNYYGFVVTKTEDTIIAKVKLTKGMNVPVINESSELLLEYPKELKKYKNIASIQLSNIDKFYFGTPRRFNVVRKYDSTFINLEVIEEKKFRIYSHNETATVTNNGFGNMVGFRNMYSRPYEAEFKILYVGKENEELIRLDGSPKEKKDKLTELLKNELDQKKLKRIKTSYDKVIKLFKELNKE